MMIKLQSLYFKLNPENEKHKYIIDTFKDCDSKIDLLYILCMRYHFSFDRIFETPKDN